MGCYVSIKDDAFLLVSKISTRCFHLRTTLRLKKCCLEKCQRSTMRQLPSSNRDLEDSRKGSFENILPPLELSEIGKKAFVWKGDEIRAYIHAPFGYEYLKIAEGCDNNCTFCIIPKIRGRQKSRAIEDVIKEAEVMITSGIREIEIICQDTTRYGTDLYNEPRLFELLKNWMPFPETSDLDCSISIQTLLLSHT